ncbi:SusC/RagA family TonB-linked outer membrane protein [Mesoflavibacter sp. CH_XMU1404-2]|uniref:SusC/RagA family TonB-linked outer membrane protein n=1 Tax=Mesoflavibacter sp. CH_XMU1404-2 TaxID=3107766 RepID=UPI00300840AE
MITTNCSYGNHLKKKMRRSLLLMIAFVFSLSIYAQEKTITGQVTSSTDGMGLPSVNVVIKGTSKGVSTDFDGNYSIEASAEDVLEFSFIGFKTKDVVVGAQSTVNVTLEEDISNLDEVVVVGYGTKKKSDLTGSVSVVNVEDAKKTVTYDVAKMLQGQAPGVQVKSNGTPGGFVDIKIRGITSFRNSNPLFVIDGVITDSPYDFATGDIESIQVLKDASSAAIYGARGANGVVIITTKKGKEGKLNVSYQSLIGFQSVPKSRWYSLANREQYQELVRVAETNAGVTPSLANYPDDPAYIDDVDTNWQEEAFRTGVIQNHSLTFNGGNQAVNYNFNLDYFNNTAYFETPQDYDRYALNLNLGGQKGKFKYGAKVAYTQSDKQNFNEYLPGTSSIISLLQAIPTMPVYDSSRKGGYGGTTELAQRAISLNVIGFNNLITNTNQRNRFLGNVWGEFEILKGLKYKINVSADKLIWNDRYYNPPSNLGWYYVTENAEARMSLNNGNVTRTILNNTLTYETTIADKHKIDVLVGMLDERSDLHRVITNSQGFEDG